LYQKLGIAAQRFGSARNLHRALQKQPPDFFVGEFIFGWATITLAQTSPIWMSPSGRCNALRRSEDHCVHASREEPHIGKLLELFPIHAVLTYPVSEQAMQAALQAPA